MNRWTGFDSVGFITYVESNAASTKPGRAYVRRKHTFLSRLKTPLARRRLDMRCEVPEDATSWTDRSCLCRDCNCCDGLVCCDCDCCCRGRSCSDKLARVVAMAGPVSPCRSSPIVLLLRRRRVSEPDAASWPDAAVAAEGWSVGNGSDRGIVSPAKD